VKVLVRLLVLIGIVAAGFGAYRMWKSGCCGQWGASDPWSTWTCDEEQESQSA
jgi:hypothetical protein